jgi:hypothetical protein
LGASQLLNCGRNCNCGNIYWDFVGLVMNWLQLYITVAAAIIFYVHHSPLFEEKAKKGID